MPHTQTPFDREAFSAMERSLLNRGRFANATVWLVRPRGRAVVVKDFSETPWPVRITIGRLLAHREFKVLHSLDGLAGVPRNAFRLDKYALAYEWAPGETLRNLEKGALPEGVFNTLEDIVKAIHERGFVHLDIRNKRNVLWDSACGPALIDFQSALGTRLMPRRLRLWLESVDLSGVYKHWAAHSPLTMGEERRRVLLWQLRFRRWWPFRGYRLPGAPGRRLYQYEKELLADKLGAPGKPDSRDERDAD